MARRNREPLTYEQRRVRRVVWTVIAGIVVLVGIVGLIYGLLGPQTSGDDAAPSMEPTPTSTSEPTPESTEDPGVVVDESVTDIGWIPEPITTSVEDYAIAAAQAGTTYDTTLATREQLIEYLATWHTEDPRLAAQADRDEALRSKIGLLARYVIVPEETWDEQASVKAILNAVPEGDVKVDYDHVSTDEGSLDDLIAAGFHNATVDLVVTYSQVDSSTGERRTFDDRISVSMQLQCGNSIPVTGSGQSPADCKLIRYYEEARV